MSTLNDARMPSLKDKHDAQEEMEVAVLDAKVVEVPEKKVKKSTKKKKDD